MSADGPPALAYAFWRLVFVFNAALLALAVGVMLVGFQGEWLRGGALVAVGAAAFAYGYWRYRRERARGVAAPDGKG